MRSMRPHDGAHNDDDAHGGLDLRRKSRRDALELAAERSRWLPRDDATLITTYARDGVPLTRLAAMLGLPRHALRYRVRRILRRLLGERFEFVVNHRGGWPAEMRAVATACYLNGWTIRRTAVQLNMSLARVRRQRDAVEALFLAASGAAGLAGAPQRTGGAAARPTRHGGAA